MEIVGAILILLGAISFLGAAIGLVRMPDVYNRLHAGTKATTLGTLLTFLGLLFLVPQWWGKSVIIIVFIMATNPVSSHVLARAAHFIGIPLTKKSVVDKLKLSENARKLKTEPKPIKN